jgi:hypothetical protein
LSTNDESVLGTQFMDYKKLFEMLRNCFDTNSKHKKMQQQVCVFLNRNKLRNYTKIKTNQRSEEQGRQKHFSC